MSTPPPTPLRTIFLMLSTSVVFVLVHHYVSVCAHFASQAARKFVEVAPELGSSFDGVVSPEDIAVYGGLCALATFSREEMKRKVLDNSSFKNFLDLVPQVRVVKPPDGNNRRYRPSVTTDGICRR